MATKNTIENGFLKKVQRRGDKKSNKENSITESKQYTKSLDTVVSSQKAPRTHDTHKTSLLGQDYSHAHAVVLNQLYLSAVRVTSKSTLTAAYEQ